MATTTPLNNLSTPIVNTTTDDNLLFFDSTTNSVTINSSNTLTSNSIYGGNTAVVNYPLNSIYTTVTYYYSNAQDWSTVINPLSKLKYSVDFMLTDANKRYLLEDHIREIKKNKMIFNCKYEGNRIQPYEFIMNLIEKKEKISVKVKVSDILTICYTNLQFTKIENNLIFNNDCDFSVLKVKFKCEKILYENHKLSEKELRTDKLKKIIKENE
jgi:hypothetical protein